MSYSVESCYGFQIFQCEWPRLRFYLVLGCHIFLQNTDVEQNMEEGELEDPKAAADQLACITVLTFCPTHKPGSMVEMCLTCRAVLALVRPEVAKELMIPEKVS